LAVHATFVQIIMWGTSLPEDKLAGDLGNVIGATSIGGSRSDFFRARKIGAGQFGTFTTISAQLGIALNPRLILVVGYFKPRRWQYRSWSLASWAGSRGRLRMIICPSRAYEKVLQNVIILGGDQ
jgi:hypothetical protein